MSNLSPFSCTFSQNLPEILSELNSTLLITTYQAGKVILIGMNERNELIQLPRNFTKAMGVALDRDKMAIATKDEVVVLKNSPRLAVKYPKKLNTYDAIYMPRAKYFTGRLDLHDLHWGNEGLWGVNTSFSCLCLINEEYSFEPKWQPYFINDLEHDDYCHLNGLAMENGQPKYVTALGKTNTPRGWKDKIVTGGILMDVPTNEIISSDLGMPHSPRIYDEKLYALLSATGEVVTIDPKNGSYDVVTRINSFIRGMTKLGDFLFVGRSKLRETSTTFEKLNNLPIGENSKNSGITIIHLPSGNIIAELNYLNSVEEIYDIQILPNIRRPGILNTETDIYTMGLDIPQCTYWADWDDNN